jgi:CheY-like chemotaxis protein
LTAVEKLLHNFNNLLAVVVGYCDMIQNDSADVRHIFQSTGRIYQSIQNSHYLLNETISLPERNVFINRLTLSDRKIKQALTVPNKKVKGNNRILLVEDDQGVNKIITTVLRKHNYTVVGCSNGEKALGIFEQSKDNFALCIVDVGLPDIEGPDLVNKLLSKKPNINVLFTSGYNEAKLKEHFDLIGPYPILIKPFRLEELLNKIRSIILR